MNYSSNKIFNNSEVNALLDRFYSELTKASGFSSLIDKICLTGRAAAIVQGAEAAECKNVILITPDAELFEVIWKKLPRLLNPSGFIVFKERVLLYFANVYLEVWYSAEPVAAALVSDVYVQKIKTIPTILL